MDTGGLESALIPSLEQGQIASHDQCEARRKTAYLRRGLLELRSTKAKKKEAEKKLDLTRKIWFAFKDIITELEKQLRSLKFKPVVQKIKELKSELEYVDMYFLGSQAG